MGILKAWAVISTAIVQVQCFRQMKTLYGICFLLPEWDYSRGVLHASIACCRFGKAVCMVVRVVHLPRARFSVARGL